MLVNRHRTVYFSLISTDLPIWNVIEAKASLYQKDHERFHLLLEQQSLPHSFISGNSQQPATQGLFWWEISPYRIMMTMQSNGKLSYRHFWERGVYGVSRYCLNSDPEQPSKSIRFRNFTRYIKVEGDSCPQNIRLEYELWLAK
ncbi:MAG: hypothetical protein AAFN00_20905, partial [Cyanobacteria bacterium J06558_2]